MQSINIVNGLEGFKISKMTATISLCSPYICIEQQWQMKINKQCRDLWLSWRRFCYLI